MIQTKAGQTIAEWALLFVVVAVILIVAINGPIRQSLNGVLSGLLKDTVNAVNVLDE